MTFFVTPKSDFAYDKVMEAIRDRQVTYSLCYDAGPTRIEIDGTDGDYLHFKELVESKKVSAYLETV